MVEAEELTNQPNPLVGRVLCGKWRIERLIGQGGMGAVYEATHRNGLKVAIKVLQAERAANSRMRARFVREGYAANKVGHPGVVAVLDDDADDDGSVFLVMELLQGETLAKRAEGGALPLDAVLRVAAGVLDVLSAAHEKGIVHRDVKPENVFLTEEGEVKLLDFGLARLREREGGGNNHTESGAALGTLGFMAPEQARGRWDLVDGRTDVWAVGALMFRLLTGRAVHRAQTPNELLIAAATEPAPSVVVRAPELPEKIVELVDRALAFERDRRWPSADAMLTVLRSVQAQLPAEVLTRRYASGQRLPAIGNATEMTTPPPSCEPAAISSHLDSHETEQSAPRQRFAQASPWILGAGIIAGVSITFALTRQAGRTTAPSATFADRAPPAAPARAQSSLQPALESVPNKSSREAPTTATAPPAAPIPHRGRQEAPRRQRLREPSAPAQAIASAESHTPLPLVEEQGEPPPRQDRSSAAPGGQPPAKQSAGSKRELLDVFD